jgi:hypothetical protein
MRLLAPAQGLRCQHLIRVLPSRDDRRRRRLLRRRRHGHPGFLAGATEGTRAHGPSRARREWRHRAADGQERDRSLSRMAGKQSRKSAYDARHRAEAFIYAQLGEVEVASLKADQPRSGLNELAKTPPRLRTKAGEKQRHRAIADDDESKRRRRASANRTLTILKAALKSGMARGESPLGRSMASGRTVREC